MESATSLPRMQACAEIQATETERPKRPAIASFTFCNFSKLSINFDKILILITIEFSKKNSNGKDQFQVIPTCQN